MFLIDDLLCAPGKAILFIFRELANKGLEELLDDESVKRELQELYNLLSSGKISEAEFEGRENRLLERLEQIARLKFQSGQSRSMRLLPCRSSNHSMAAHPRMLPTRRTLL
jgi:hypothetical protein